MQFAKKNLERLSEADVRRWVNPVICQMESTLLPKDTQNILATAVLIELFRLLMLQTRATKDSIA